MSLVRSFHFDSKVERENILILWRNELNKPITTLYQQIPFLYRRQQVPTLAKNKKKPSTSEALRSFPKIPRSLGAPQKRSSLLHLPRLLSFPSPAATFSASLPRFSSLISPRRQPPPPPPGRMAAAAGGRCKTGVAAWPRAPGTPPSSGFSLSPSLLGEARARQRENLENLALYAYIHIYVRSLCICVYTGARARARV